MKSLLRFSACLFMALFITNNTFAQVSITADTAQGCAPVTINFSNKTHDYTDTTGMRFEYDFGDGMGSVPVTYDTSYTFNSSGSYYIYLYAYDSLDNFVGYEYVNVEVHGPIEEFFPSDSSQFCANTLLYFYHNASVDTTWWDFGNGDTGDYNYFDYTYLANGTYTVQLVTASVCGRDTLEQTIIIADSITPDIGSFSSNTFVCPGENINFGVWSINYSLDSARWYFGDGNTSDLFNASHTYADTGTYEVIVHIYTACGGTNSDTLTITVNESVPFVVGFNYWSNPSCPLQDVSFNAWSVYDQYHWQFGDGFTSTKQSPKHSYADTGSYDVTLIATSFCGTIDTVTHTVDIEFNTGFSNSAYSDFNAFQGADTVSVCPNEAVEMYGWGNDITIQNLWNFGDGDSAFTGQTQHAYDSLGIYEVTYYATNNCGNIDSAYLWVKVDTLGGTPVSGLEAFPSTAICPGSSVYFYDTEAFDGNNSYLYDIWFGDGDSLLNLPGIDTSNQFNVTAIHAYADTGSYTYYFIVKNNCGGADTLSGVVVVSDTVGSPQYYVANTASGAGLCPGDSVEFSAAGGKSYTWDFGDGSPTDTGSVVKHAYAAVNSYTVNVFIINNCNDTDTVATTANIITVFPSGNINSDKNFTCAYDTISFYFSPNNNETYTYEWSFDDGDSAFVQSPQHAFATSGSYNVTVKVYNSCGLSNTYSTNITINAPFVDFSGLDTLYCYYADSSLLTGTPAGGVFSGNGINNDYFNPVAAGPGTHTITYTYTNHLGCANSASYIATVTSPGFTAFPADTCVCDGNSVDLVASGADSYLWEDNSTASTLAVTPSSGTYYSLTATDIYGCEETDSTFVCVRALPGTSAGADDALCVGDSIQLTASNALSYSWTPAASLSNANIADPFAGPSVTTVYVVTGTDVYGCFDADSVEITVNSLPLISVNNDTNLCLGDTIALLAGGANSYSWSPATGLSATNIAAPNAYPSVTTTYVVSGTSLDGCVDSNDVTITILTVPVATAGDTAYSCPGNTVNLWALGGDSYSWSDGSNMVGNTANIAVNPLVTTDYSVEVSNVCGSDTAYVPVYVDTNSAVVNAGTDILACDGDNVQIKATGIGSITWYNSGWFLGYSNPHSFTATDTVTFYAIATSACQADTDTIVVNVAALPQVLLTLATDTFCDTDPAQTLSGGTPSGGTYSGPGVSGGQFDPASAGIGTHTITYSYTDGNGCSGSATQQVFVDICAGIEDHVTLKELRLNPNPASERFMLSFRLPETQSLLRISLIDINGRVLSSEEHSGFAGRYKKEFNIAALQAGIYLLRIETDGEQLMKTVVVAR